MTRSVPSYEPRRATSLSVIAGGRPDHAGRSTSPRERTCGKVTLVGAGPGGADLITVRGAAALGAADVVIFDRLADPELVGLAPRRAERVAVGKGKGYGPTQEQICDLMVDRALEGKNVVRLKGGDPFVFGRGREESDAAVAAGIEVEVVPGVSSALGAPALAGISLTDRRLASSFTVLTGHRCDGSDHEWRAFAESGSTLVVLMAATTADAVARRLVADGRDPHDPVAFVHAAGTSAEQVSRSDLTETTRFGCPFPSPTVMVVGAVADTEASTPTVRSDEEMTGLAHAT